MSTTIKRVALVAVAALGLGVLSVAPSQAAHLGDTLTLTPVTSSISTGDSATATVNSAFLGVAEGDSITVNALIASKPSTGAANLQFVVVDSYTATQHSATASAIGTTASISTGVTAASTAANTNYRLALVNPTVAGTYVVQVYATVGASGAGTATIRSSVLSWSVTVAAVDTKADATSVSRLVKGNIDPTAYLANTDITTDSSTVVSKAATGIQAVIKVTQKSAVTTAVPAEDMLVTISGPGTIAKHGTFGSLPSTGSARALTVASTDFVSVYADGTTGVSTITFTGSKSGVVLAKKTVTFFDTKPAAVKATVKKAYILAGTDTVLKVLAVTVTDANGNPVTTATITAAATDTATTVGGAATCLTYDATDKVYYCGIAGKSATKFGKVNYTITAADAEATPNKVTTTADVTFSSAVPASITITPAATTANPGAVVTYTLTATDANGFPIADGDYNTNATPWFKSVTASGFGTAPFAKADTITTVSGVATSDATLAIAGTGAASWTLVGSATAPTGTVVAKALEATAVASADVTISNPGVDAATDAANEAAQAASDATDAALAAADAADAATTKAQEAVDAVATLSAEVSKLITALKAQITTLTNLVIKIQKKVKA